MGGTAKLARADGGSCIAHPGRGSQNRARRRQASRRHCNGRRRGGDVLKVVITGGTGFIGRSEEHTSELQSLMRISYAVFCLTKKKNIRYSDTTTVTITP